MERFAALPDARRDAVTDRFAAHADALLRRLELSEVAGAGTACLATRTMRTLDLSARWPGCAFDAARTMHRDIARQSPQWLAQAISLGQPVRTHTLPFVRAAGTLRLAAPKSVV